jgi:hypothetical protein
MPKSLLKLKRNCDLSVIPALPSASEAFSNSAAYHAPSLSHLLRATLCTVRNHSASHQNGTKLEFLNHKNNLLMVK